jgi:putative ABC transport system permease protein
MRQLLATLRHRPAPLVGIFVALVAAASIVTWAFSIGNAASTSTLPTPRLAGATVVVTGNPTITLTTGTGYTASTSQFPLTSYRRVPADLATTLGALPGVRTAVAEQSVPLALLLRSGRVVTGTGTEPTTGYGWPSAALTPFTLRSGHAPRGPHQLVVGAGLARSTGLGLGEQVRLVGRPSSPFTVVGIAAAPTGDPAGDWTVFLSEHEATLLYGHAGQADLVGVVAKAGMSPTALAARVRAAIAGRHLTVLTGSGRGAVENLTAESDLSNLSSFGGTGVIFVFVSLFVVASTVALSIAERERTMALLRAVGATPGQVRRMVMTELGALGLVGGLAGYLPGIWLASLSVHYLAAHGLVPSSTRPWTSPIELVPSVLFGIGIAELAGLFAARRASRTHPAAALTEASVERRFPRPLRLVLGLCALGGGVALGAITLGQADASAQLEQAQTVLLTFMAGVALLGPYLVTIAEIVLRLPLRLLGRTPGRLASAQVRARPRRFAAAAVAIALPVCFAGAIVTMDATQAHGSVTESRQRLAAAAVVTAPGPGLAPSALAAIRHEQGVGAAVGLVPTNVYLSYQGGLDASAEGATSGPIGSLLHLEVTSGSLTHFGRGDIALSGLVAGKGGMDVHVGETITTYLADGAVYRAEVTAIFSRSLGFADVLVPTQAAGGGHLGTDSLGEILVGASPGTRAATLSREIGSLSASYPGLRVASRSVANAQDELVDTQTSYANDLLVALVGLLAAVALVNTLVMTALEGRDELVLLLRVGATVRQLIAKAAWEVISVTLVGAVLGLLAASEAVAGIATALTGSWAPSIPVGSLAEIIGLVVALTSLAAILPTFLALRAGETR